MRYEKVCLESIGYELAPVVVTSRELEERLASLYDRLHLQIGQLEALTGIAERRWWSSGQSLVDGAAAAAAKAIHHTSVPPNEIDVLIYAGVCRELYEPATACAVAYRVGISDTAHVYDISNACLGVINGIIDIANRIELGQIRAGLIVSCESARQINDIMIEQMVHQQSMQQLSLSLATLTGGSGAAAVLVTDGSFGHEAPHRLVGGVARTAPQHHELCRWGMFPAESGHNGSPVFAERMQTDSVGVLKHGVQLGRETWNDFLTALDWPSKSVDRVICHQVGGGHKDQVLKALDIPEDKDFSTYAYLGNIGTVSLPLTAAIADQRRFLNPGDRVAFLGIGSGLNCMMLGWEW